MLVKSRIDTYTGRKSGMTIVLKVNKKDSPDAEKMIGNFESMPLNVKFEIDSKEKLNLNMNMLVKCEIDTYTGRKNSLTIVLKINKKDSPAVKKMIGNFTNMPLDVTFDIDAKEKLKIMNMINDDQRRKAYAILGDIAKFNGERDSENTKIQLKPLFIEAYPKYEMFSLSNCSKELAKDFIQYLIILCFKMGIPLYNHPRELMDDDVYTYLYLCLKYRKCVICGGKAELAHVDSIGMGRDRTKVDDSKNLKMALCNRHHQTGGDSIHTLGVETFCVLNHVYGIEFTG